MTNDLPIRLPRFSSDYVEHRLEPRRVKTPPAITKPEGVFDGLSVYQTEYTADYRAWEVSQHKPCGPQRQYVPPSVAFGGEATYASDYKNYGPVKPVGACRPAITRAMSYGSVDENSYMTDYRDSYLPPPEGFTVQHAKKPNPARVDYGPFDGATTFKLDYGPKHAERRQDCRPKQEPVTSDTPFSKDTTNRVDYKEWPLPEHYYHTAAKYHPPEGEFMDRTTYNVTFVPMDASARAKPIRPKEARPNENRQFYSATDYGDSYREWPLSSRALRRKKGPDYLPPEVPFQGLSIQQTDYIQHPGARKLSSCMKKFEHKTDVLNSDDRKFNGQTMYRQEFTEKHTQVCPALLLVRNGKLVFKGEDERGHQLYGPPPGDRSAGMVSAS
ncbi:unnamed protein product [Schistocephalus solidus]|uniref:Stabilizer of axonemal microtubules 2 n=1 Tax=Schistocephalus solidus TaxID=70667 RepID=A0A183SUY1_SCHSO|nr:unnamed protein product [Schistocephalus solidus]